MSVPWDTMSKALAQHLETAGVLNYEDGVGGNVFVERKLPLAPDEAILIRSTGGFEASPVDQPMFQIVARAPAPQWATAKLRAVYDQLHGKGRFALPNGVYVVFALAVQSGPVPLGQDEQGRWQFASNYRLMVEP